MAKWSIWEIFSLFYFSFSLICWIYTSITFGVLSSYIEAFLSIVFWFIFGLILTNIKRLEFVFEEGEKIREGR